MKPIEIPLSPIIFLLIIVIGYLALAGWGKRDLIVELFTVGCLIVTFVSYQWVRIAIESVVSGFFVIINQVRPDLFSRQFKFAPDLVPWVNAISIFALAFLSWAFGSLLGKDEKRKKTFRFSALLVRTGNLVFTCYLILEELYKSQTFKDRSRNLGFLKDFTLSLPSFPGIDLNMNAPNTTNPFLPFAGIIYILFGVMVFFPLVTIFFRPPNNPPGAPKPKIRLTLLLALILGVLFAALILGGG